MSEWEKTTLGSLFRVDNNKLGPHSTEPTVMSLSKYDGFVRAEDYFDKRIASANLDGYKVVEPGGWAFSTIHIDEGSIARNNLGEVGAISPMYTTMRWIAEDHLPEYAELLVREPTMLSEYVSRAQGSINRRRSLPFKNFAAIPVRLPSLAEQNRIVDVMAAVDAQIGALSSEVERLTAATVRLRDDYPEAEEIALDDLLDGIDSGRSVQTTGDAPVFGEARVLKLSAVRPGRFDPSEAKRLDDLTGFTSSHRVTEGDLLVTRANTPERVGYVVVARGVPERTYMPDLIWRARVSRSLVSPGYLGHLLSASEFRSRITATAGGTSVSMVKINKRGFGNVRVPVPSLDAQESYVLRCDAIQQAAVMLEVELARLRMFRSTLLTSLLNQDIEIPERYDELLETNS